jgi:hypothetical protein
MRNRILWSALALLATLALVGGGDAQPPGKKGGKFGKKGGVGLTADQIVERIMALDKNNDGKVTMDELPERMQHLIAMGDTNKDGALDREEVRKLAATLEAFVSFAGPGGGKGGGKGFAKGGLKGFGKGGFGEGPIQAALDELNLSEKTREKAEAAAKEHREKVRVLQDLARADLLLRMRDVLSEADYTSFKASMERDPGPPFGFAKKKGKKKGGGGE